MDGIETLRELRRLVPSLPVVMMTAYADVPTAVAAMKAGAADYVTKPFDPDELTAIVRQAVERAAVPSEAAWGAAAAAPWGFEDFAGPSPAMTRVLELARAAAETDAAVLLRGERGLGKECLARAIYGASRRRPGPFVPVHCGGLSESVLEAELFGYEAGTLPASPHAKKGRLELADRGFLYLDEIQTLSQKLQSALLHAIEDRAVVRLGGEKRQPVDVRPVAASSEDIEAMVRQGSFLVELFGAISVVVIDVPPLRARREDIAPLLGRVLLRVRRDLDKKVDAFSPETVAILTRQDWPGNVRQLARTVERAVVACPGTIILPEHLPIG
ncbi:MAG: sigma-54-dependent Fis family transcriptional regulator [Deltaproteobacteria bacterium]|nr:sigma-54-dependent Fis family transcriptional regulator [Deltaproteobacteria bacterium]